MYNKDEEIELTILMPCLNESETLETCIKKAKMSIEKNNIKGEILIADNGSTDGSIDIALKNGARVVSVKERGYGNALIEGTKDAHGKYIIMGDSDDSYDFSNITIFIEKLREGYDLVMGNRFKGGIEKGAMPWSHKYIGTPIISFLGRLFYKTKIKDFNCGMRGYNRESILKLNLRCTGMEYASEMIVSASLNNLRIAEVPTTLKKDGRTRKPYLKTFSDGWRHLKFLLMYTPKWLFLVPGIILILLGFLGTGLLWFGKLHINNVVFGIHSLLYFGAMIAVGLQIITFSVMAKIYAMNSNMHPKDEKLIRIFNKINLEKILVLGICVFLFGLGLSIYSVIIWGKASYR